MCRDEVMMATEEISKAPPGSETFFSHLQAVTTEMWNDLPPKEKESYVRLAKKWSDETPPPDVQAR
jgi:hypothetical protein